MLFSRLGKGALAMVAAALPFLGTPALADDSDGPSTFVSDDGNIAFALTTPKDEGTNVYFSLRVSASRTWGAVGLGSHSMKDSLIFMLYRDADGQNVTFSPRLAKGNYEPEYFDEMEWDVLNGTGIVEDDDGHQFMSFSARCREHCRSWPGGSIDFSDENQQAIYALGPAGSLRYDSRSADLPIHREHGKFTINMKRTDHESGAVQLDGDTESEGTELVEHHNGGRDFKATFHAVFMILAMVILVPLGQLLMIMGKWVKLHAATMTTVLIFSIIGASLGIATSFQYQRSRNFDSAHQIIGLMVFVFLFGQFALGFMHHRQYKQTQAPTKLAMPHRWLGRLIMFLGILNAFFGFPFALNRQFNYLLAGLVIAITALSCLLIFGRRWIKRRKNHNPTGPYPVNGYGAELAHQQQQGGNVAPQAGYGPAGYGPAGVASPPPYQYSQYSYGQPPQASPGSPPGQGISLNNMSGYQRGHTKETSVSSTNDVGTAQNPRDMV